MTPLSPLEVALARVRLEGQALATNKQHGVTLIASRCAHGTVRVGVVIAQLQAILDLKDWRKAAYLEGWQPVIANHTEEPAPCPKT